MAAYTIVDWKTSEGPVDEVMAAIETKLEALDSTSNSLYLITILPISPSVFVGVLVYKG